MFETVDEIKIMCGITGDISSYQTQCTNNVGVLIYKVSFLQADAIK